jgi:hypothetical protein
MDAGTGFIDLDQTASGAGRSRDTMAPQAEEGGRAPAGLS